MQSFWVSNKRSWILKSLIKSNQVLQCKIIDQHFAWKIVPNINVTDATYSGGFPTLILYHGDNSATTG